MASVHPSEPFDIPFREGPAKANRAIASAWESFVARGMFIGEAPRTVIARSWQRCRQLGISPGTERAPGGIGLEEVESILAEQALGRAGRQVLDVYEGLVQGSGHVIVFGDREGRLLYSVGQRRIRDRLEKINFMPGATWSEAAVGPNGIGTPIALGHPELVFGTEHYCQGWQPWVCYGSPVRDPDSGEVIGAVDITGPARLAQVETMALAIAIARAVEQNLQLDELRRRDLLRSRFRDLERRWPSHHGLILINANGRIVDINGAGVRLLDLESTAFLNGPLAHASAELWMVCRGAAPGTVQEIEIPRRAGGGAGRRLKFRIEVVAREGRPVGSLLVISESPSAAGRIAAASGRPMGPARPGFEHLAGGCEAFRRAVGVARKAAEDRRANPVLLLGASGTGKTAFAHAIHAASARTRQPLIAVNCRSLPADRGDRELFGHADGRFAGGGAAGKCEAADSGTLYLEEVDALPSPLQAKLLQVIEDGAVTRVGAATATRVNVRFIASAGPDLRSGVDSGAFRLDLFQRLGILEVELPPLRERGEDIDLLLGHFLNRACAEAGRGRLTVAAEVREQLHGYDWPGNVRELRDLCARWAAVIDGERVEPAHLPASMQVPRPAEARAGVSEVKSLYDIKDEAILRMLEECGGRVGEAARRLGIDRTTIYRRMKRRAPH